MPKALAYGNIFEAVSDKEKPAIAFGLVAEISANLLTRT
jgi:hypothetical protein